MGAFVDRLMRLWTGPLADQAAAEAAFRELYTDPVRVNGTDLTVADLVVRARALQTAYADLGHELVDEVHAGDKLVIGFRMTGRHVGPLATPLGTVPPTGREMVTRVTDILTVRDGRISDIWVVS